MQTNDPQDVGIDAQRLRRLPAAIASDVEAGLYDGAVIAVGRHGKLVLHEAIGYADRAAGRAARLDDVFSVLSLSKTLTNVLVLSCCERGTLRLTMPVAEVIPEFAVLGKQRITIFDLLAHTGGMGGMPPFPLDHMPLDQAIAAICMLPPLSRPGMAVSYSGLAAHALLAEMVRRVDGGQRRFRQILEEDLLQPLGMGDTSLGQRADLQSRRVPIVVRDQRPGLLPPPMLEALNAALGEGSEVPAIGVQSTAADFFRFGEMLRRGGELDGVRLLSPLSIDLATTNQTGTMVNELWAYARESRGWSEFPAFLGLGFALRGEGIFPHHFGTLASPRTFGHAGAGATLFWVDPARDVCFVALTAGLVEESGSVERFQRLSDIALASIAQP
ncbi:MAG: beta-lactamase family protein [Gammaproteobacteria bacterium]|nr:beta-lactamase family protein [Gammaproteobacteria bacterium]